MLGEAAVRVVGGDIEGPVGDDGSISIGGTPEAVDVLGVADDRASLVDVSTLDAVDPDRPFGAETGGSSSHQIPTSRS